MTNIIRENLEALLQTTKKGTLYICLTEHGFEFQLEDVAGWGTQDSLIIIKLKENLNDFYAIDTNHVQAYYYTENDEEESNYAHLEDAKYEVV